MSLALAAALGSVLLLIASQVRRRMSGNPQWIDWFIRGLAVFVIVLAAIYFYQRVIT